MAEKRSGSGSRSAIIIIILIIIIIIITIIYTFADILERKSINEVHDDTVPVEVPGGGDREPTVLQGFHVCKFRQT
jgi:hypothetical protein